MFLTAFLMVAVLLPASHPPGFRQGASAISERDSPAGAKQAEELFQSALLLYDSQEREPARLRLQEAMRLWAQVREPGKAGKAALQLGDRGKQARNYQDALDYYHLALGVKSLPGMVRTNALDAIAQVYAGLHHPDLAIRYFIEARNQARLINDLPAQSRALTGLADLYYQKREKAQALACIAEAQQLNRRTNADADPALLSLLGQVRQEEGLVEEAKAAFEEALAAHEKSRNVEGRVKALCSLSALSLISSQNRAALEHAQQAVDLAEKQVKLVVTHADRVGVRELQWIAWLSLARAQRALGQDDNALRSYFRVRSHFEGAWWSSYIVTEATAMAFREKAQAASREYVDLLVEKERFKEAFEVADEAKARVILNFTQARRAAPRPRDAGQEAALRDLSESTARLRLEMLSSDLSREREAILRKEIGEAESKVREAQLRDEMARSRDRLVWSQLGNAEQLQKKMAPDQMALAEFSLGEKRSFVWLFTQGEVFYDVRPARKEIEEAVRSYLAALAAAPNPRYIDRDLAQLRVQAAALFSTLFGRLSEKIEPSRRLIVVPDGLLHYLPFESLIRNGRYLVEGHEISYNSSAGMLGLWEDSAGGVESDDRMELLAVGDPVFEPESTAIGGKIRGTRLKTKARRMPAARGSRLARLPRTRDEVQYIAKLFPPDRRKVFLGMGSTEDAVKREPLRRYRRLHFATHSLIDEESPLRSAVMLTPGDATGEDGSLEVREIAGLSLDCDLLVVSACRTGRGQLLSGEGIVGLSRAFLYAGARSVVVSLWDVSDISTSQFMKGFYQHLVGGAGNAAALREAKLEMILSRQTRHPYYWASFVMAGKP